MDVATLVAGEALIDLVPQDKHYVARVGGSPLNLACCLARLGAKAIFTSAVSEDTFGRAIRTRLDEAGVLPDALQSTTSPSSLALADIDEQGKANYNFYLKGTSVEEYRWSDSLSGIGFTHLHLGSYYCCAETHVQATLEWLAGLPRRITRSLDVNVRLGLTPGAQRVAGCIDQFVDQFDLIKASDEDLELLYPGTNPTQLAREWRARGVNLVVITAGENGGCAFFGDERLDYVAPRVANVVDTIGCGDAFMAGLLYILGKAEAASVDGASKMERNRLVQALDFASDLAAYNCTIKGAGNPGLEELQAWRMR